MNMLFKKTITLKNLPEIRKVLKHKINKFDFLTLKDIAIMRQSEKEFANGEGISSEIVFKELREKYGY